MRSFQSRRRRRKSLLDYILPFLLIVSVGIIGVIGFQVWSQWDKQGKADVYFYIAEGNAKMLPYGETSWTNAFSGTKLLLGDSLKTSSFGRVVLEFFNGTKVRMGRDTAVTLADLTKESDRETIVLNLENGMIWLNGQKSEGVRDAHYEVRTSHMHVKAEGTIFEVENNSVEAVRVLDGDVKVDIIVGSGGSERVANTISVGIGQELILDDASLRAFEDNKSPSLLTAISEDFENGSWYRWNMEEDSSPTDFSGSSPVSSVSDDDSDDTADVDSDEDDTGDDDEADVANNIIGDEGGPEITEPMFSSTDTGEFAIKGTVPDGTVRVDVKAEYGGNTDTHTLSKFTEGDTEFSYNVSEAIGNIDEGSNTYTVYAYDADDNRSSASIEITYEKEEAEVTGDLEDPVVLTYNGSDSSDVAESVVTVKGSVKGAAGVVVNGYELTQFSPGETEWTYVASEDLGNLELGENEYEVYAVDPDGNKSSTVKFVINYEKDEDAEEEEGAGSEEVPSGFGF